MVESTSAIVPERRLRRTTGARRLARRRAERQRRLDLRAPSRAFVAEAVERDRGGRHRVADHHPADRDEVARLGLEDAERDDEAERRAAGDARARSAAARTRAGTLRARLRAVSAPNSTITAISASDQRQAVLVEDQLDHVADRGQLDERAHDRDPDVALEVGAAPDRDRDRDRDQRQRAGDLGRG